MAHTHPTFELLGKLQINPSIHYESLSPGQKVHLLEHLERVDKRDIFKMLPLWLGAHIQIKAEAKDYKLTPDSLTGKLPATLCQQVHLSVKIDWVCIDVGADTYNADLAGRLDTLYPPCGLRPFF